MNDPLYEVFQVVKSLSTLVQDQQRQIDSLKRSQSHMLDALGLLAGESSPETPRPINSQAIAQAKREIEQLEKLFGGDNDLPPAA